MYLNRMKKLREYIAATPAGKIKMNRWLEHGKGNEDFDDIMAEFSVNNSVINTKRKDLVDHFKSQGCGTAGCIAGWGAVCFNLIGAKKPFRMNTVSEHLGLNWIEKEYLFYGEWFIQTLNEFDKLPSKKRKSLILKVLDSIIEKGFPDNIQPKSTVYDRPNGKIKNFYGV